MKVLIEISLYRKYLFVARDTNDPNDCRIDPSDENSKCPPVIGNVLIYRQGSHLTKTYVESLAPRLEAELARAGVR